MALTQVPAALVAADVATQAELDAEAASRAAGDVKLTGDVVQVVSFQTGAVATGTTTIPQDDTIPQSSEGDQYMTLAITPTNSANILVIEVVLILTAAAANTAGVALFQDSTANALAGVLQYIGSTNAINAVNFKHKMTAGTTSATTFKVRAGLGSAGTLTVNGLGGGRLYGGVLASGITITEIKA
jgi:hypothetical protein